MDRLRATIPSPRMARYSAACAGTSVDPIELYRWAGGVALAVFDDLGHLEIAMRSAMAHELSSLYGLQWHTRTDLLDDETLKLISTARRVGRLDQLGPSSDVFHGKLVATLMFGFWVKILGRGGYQGQGAARQRRIYDTLLWKAALRKAFPNVGDLDRAVVEASARGVQALRNRVAHHEHIVWGVPIPGERQQDGSTVRLSLTQAHGSLLSLAGFVDSSLESWLRQYSRVDTELGKCPLPTTTMLLL